MFYVEFSGKVPTRLLGMDQEIGFAIYREGRLIETILPKIAPDGTFKFRTRFINDFPDCVKLEIKENSYGEYCKRRLETGAMDYYNPELRRAIPLPTGISKGRLYEMKNFDY